MFLLTKQDLKLKYTHTQISSMVSNERVSLKPPEAARTSKILLFFPFELQLISTGKGFLLKKLQKVTL